MQSPSQSRCHPLPGAELAPLGTRVRPLLQCLWARSIIAVIAALPTIAPDTETAISILQAIRSYDASYRITSSCGHRN